MSKIVFIGGGNMASCLIGGMLANGFSSQDITVSEPNEDSRQRMKSTHGVLTTADNLAAVSQADIVVLAVKPQIMAAVASPLEAKLKHKPIIVSIAAGIPVGALQSWLGQDLKIVRAMPNTPAMVQSGATGLFANQSLDGGQQAMIENIFSAVGYACWVAQESDIDAVTAVSGSGPAYFFLVYEAMLKVAQELGLEKQTASQLTLHTALGAARLALASESTPNELREQVTSPGGTTQAAIESFQAQDLEGIFRTAMTSALERAKEMSDDFAG
ncbi:MAG: pyrroline-5-carboxylate reductase [Porticoccaceae bacterium]|jgi:pyrroline-5-carboxylate reductase